MTTTEAKQFRLNDEGQILYQRDPTNPLPGLPVASVQKGAALLQPEIAIQEGLLPEGEARDTVLSGLREWLATHIKTVLETLVALEQTEGEGIDDQVRGISARLHESLGICLRSDIESTIAGLTPEGRRTLRQRRVRLGPVLVFIPDLNKPAAVRLRAVLWNLWHDKPLPAAIPPNGMTSFKVENADVDFYRAIGYPVYGPRAIRVDMLDRLISAVYDNAKDGQFQAKHQMSEWLGCPIADLYAVLEAMGHVKTHDPADAPKPVEAVEAKPENAVEAALLLLAATPPVETQDIQPAAELAPSETLPEGSAVETVSAPVEVKPVHVRPELATFRLRKGRAYGGQPRSARPDNRTDHSTGDRPEKKPWQGNKDKTGQHKKDDKSFRPRDKKGKPDRHEREDRVITAAAPPPKPESSPFAALKLLKMNAKE